jgi:hypothetical protein
MFWNKKEKKTIACKNCKYFRYDYHGDTSINWKGIKYLYHCGYSKEKFDPVEGIYIEQPWACESVERNGYGNCRYFCEKESENE